MGRRRKGHLRSLRTHSERTQSREAGKEFSHCPSVCLTVSTLFTSLLNTAGSPPLRAASIMFTVGPPEPEVHKSFKAWTMLIRFFFSSFFFFEGQEWRFSDWRRKSVFIDKDAAPFTGAELSQLLSRILLFNTLFLIRPQPRRGAHRAGSSQP